MWPIKRAFDDGCSLRRVASGSRTVLIRRQVSTDSRTLTRNSETSLIASDIPSVIHLAKSANRGKRTKADANVGEAQAIDCQRIKRKSSILLGYSESNFKTPTLSANPALRLSADILAFWRETISRRRGVVDGPFRPRDLGIEHEMSAGDIFA